MTTILFWKTKDKIFIGADSQTTAGNLKLPINAPKIQVVGEKCICAGSGSVGNLQQILNIATKDLQMRRLLADSESLDIEVSELAKELAVLNFQLPLEHKHFNPFGFLIGGIEADTPIGYSVSDDGAMIRLEDYFAEGSGTELALSLLQAQYNPELKDGDIAKILFDIIIRVSKSEIYTNEVPLIVSVDAQGTKQWKFEIEQPKEDKKPATKNNKR